MKVLTEQMLRSEILSKQIDEYVVGTDVFVTPSAREYLLSRKIELRVIGEDGEKKKYSQKEMEDMTQYIDASTNRVLYEKPENLTHLRANVLVEKTHPRIMLRGKLDVLISHIVEVQIEAKEIGRQSLFDYLGDCVKMLHRILYAEVTEKPIEDSLLMGLTEKELRQMSHHPKKYFGTDHLFIDAQMPKIVIRLNTLRANVREAELAMSVALGNERQDLLRILNRMSSAMYILMCMCYSGKESIK